MKTQLRQELKQKRKNITNKDIKDKIICDSLLSSDYYINAKTVLCYVSFGDEVNTELIIDAALKGKKKVAVPYCTDKKGVMEFYLINSFDDLVKGSYVIYEPDIDKCEKLDDFGSSIIIVPALSFDKRGYRLGYGGGYYDRFLANYSGTAIGLSYNEMLIESVPTDKYDKKVDIIITDKQTYFCK